MRFELTLAGGAFAASHRRLTGDLERSLPWSSLDASQLTGESASAARRRWTALAFNEHRSSIAMAQVLQSLGEAQAPLDLHTMACAFPMQELAHAEMCARVVAQLGGGADLELPTLEPRLETAAALTPQQRCREHVVRFCCVGETISKSWLACMRGRVRQPLVRAVLSRILRDEACHSAFGWLYLDWCLDEGAIDETERARLETVARIALETYRTGAAIGAPEGRVRDERDEVAQDVLLILPSAEARAWAGRAVGEVTRAFARRGLDVRSAPSGPAEPPAARGTAGTVTLSREGSGPGVQAAVHSRRTSTALACRRREAQAT